MDEKIREALEKGEIVVHFDHPAEKMLERWGAPHGVWISNTHGVYQTQLIIDTALTLGWAPEDKAQIWAIQHTWLHYFGEQTSFKFMNEMRAKAGLAVMGENDSAPEDVPVELDLICDDATDWFNAHLRLTAEEGADEELRQLIEEDEIVAWFGHHPDGGDVGVWVERIGM